MMERPRSVTVIAWILIITGALSLITSATTINNPTVRELMSRSPVPLSAQFAMMFLGILVTLLTGTVLLAGKNWARYLYVIWGVIGFAFSLATSPIKLPIIPGLIFFAIITFFLFRPKANEYFTGREGQVDAQRI